MKPLPPTPRGHFLVGNILEMVRDPMFCASRFARELGDVFRVRVGPLTFYMLVHPDAIEQVLRRDHRKFIKDKGTRLLRRVLGDGMLTSEGELWRRQRRLAQPAFQQEAIQSYGGTMVHAASGLIDQWRPGQTRDVHAEMTRLTMEIAAQTFLGTSVADKADLVGKAMRDVMEYFSSLLVLVPLVRWLPTPGNLRFWRACRKLDQVFYETIAERRRSSPNTAGNDLLSRLLAARDEDGGQLIDKELRDEMVTLFLAGHETTAIALTFSFYLLALHPDAEARMVAELEEVLEGRPPTIEMLPRLRYTEWIVKEAMRLYPPAPNIGREALEDIEISGYRIPRGSQISLVQWVTQRDPRWFDNPEEFRPERWDNDLARRLPRCAYFPFGDGPRICIGNLFAMMEAVLILATVAQRYRLALEPDYKLDILFSVTIRPRHGLPMVLHERAQKQAALPASSF